MKTKELIRQLQEADPEGEFECMVHGEDIIAVGREPGYYDGAYQVLIRDPKNPYYNVTAIKVTKENFKVRIFTHSIEDALSDEPNMPVVLDPSLGFSLPEWEKRIQKWRDDAIALNEEVEAWSKQQKKSP